VGFIGKENRNAVRIARKSDRHTCGKEFITGSNAKSAGDERVLPNDHSDERQWTDRADRCSVFHPTADQAEVGALNTA
jgi:hypothetical protein